MGWFSRRKEAKSVDEFCSGCEYYSDDPETVANRPCGKLGPLKNYNAGQCFDGNYEGTPVDRYLDRIVFEDTAFPRDRIDELRQAIEDSRPKRLPELPGKKG